MYPIESKPASKNGWFTPAEARSYYGKYDREGVTIHWWGDGTDASNHDNIVNYLNGKAAQGQAPTVNYVLSDNKITECINPDNVAWCSNNGNPTTISIEHQPTLGAEGYKKSGWLIWQLEKRYNRKLTLYPHNYWTGTQCPGTIDLNRIRQEANNWANGAYTPQPPAPVPATATLKWTKFDTVQQYVTNKQPTNLWDFNKTTWSMTSVKPFNKGETINIYGKCVNETLNATYFVTEYSFTKRITNGFNQADLDVYVVPAPVPTPVPEPSPETPDHGAEPTPPPIEPAPEVPKEDSDFERRLTNLEKMVKAIVEFLTGLFKNFKI